MKYLEQGRRQSEDAIMEEIRYIQNAYKDMDGEGFVRGYKAGIHHVIQLVELKIMRLRVERSTKGLN